MRILLLAVSCLITTISSTSFVLPHVDPPLRVTLQIDGQEHALVNDELVTLTIDGRQRRVKATVRPTRLFDAAGVQFEFPRHFVFEQNDSETLTRWSVDGDGVTLIVFAQKNGSHELAPTMLRSLSGTEEATPTELVLAGKPHRAFATEVARGSVRFRFVAADLAVGTTGVLLYVQSTLDDDGATSSDSQRVLDLLAKTFVVTSTK